MNRIRALAPEILDRYPADRPRSGLLPLLSAAQEAEGYVSPDAIDQIAEVVGISAAEVTGVASFYSMLHLQPKGKHVISVCHNLACSLLGAERLIDEMEEALGVVSGETTPDGEFTLERVECLAACGMAPMLQVDYDRMIGPVRAAQVQSLIEGIRDPKAGEAISLEALPALTPVPQPSAQASPGEALPEAPTDAEARWVAEERLEETKPPTPESDYEEPLLVESFELSRSDERLLHLEDDDIEGDAT